MAPITVRGVKPFTWSYSKMKNFDACPKKHYETDVLKSVKEPDSETLKWGNTVHAGLAAYIEARDKAKKGLIADAGPIMTGLEPYKHHVENFLHGEGIIYVEQKLAITKDFAACGYFDPTVWFRAAGDAIKINHDVGLIVDWKTGKILEDSLQLALSAACVFAKHPEVQAVRSEFVWLKENATTREDFFRSDMPAIWRAVWPRIEELEHAHKTTTYPAKPGGLCEKYCAVKSCSHNGHRGGRIA